MADSVAARVFVSCGQASSSEIEGTKELGRILREDYGYEAYVAREQISLQGVKEAIFPQLEDAEYLLFVDFARDRLAKEEYRGSLFSHQELAIAAYLETPYIGFRHKSVRREGISQFLLSNVPEFEDPAELPKLLREQLSRRSDWDAKWRKELRMSRQDSGEGDDMLTANEPCRYFHLTVENLHRNKLALGCTAYVEAIGDVPTSQPIEFRPAELKWAGTMLPSVPIPSGRRRALDACRFFGSTPETIHFVSHADSGKHMGPIRGREIDVTYLVVSENFSPARCTLRIKPGKTTQDTTVLMR